MKLLAFDTAMAACSAAVIDTEQEVTLARRYLAMERGHAEALAPMVEEAMAEARLAFSELDRIAVTTGPGTFTGVRIGLSFARGLGLALELPVIGIDTLSAIAANTGDLRRPILVAADARKDEVYAALFGGNRQMLRKPAVCSPADAAADLPPDTLIIGQGGERVAAHCGGRFERSMAGDLPDASNFTWVAARMPAPEEMPVPLYLRMPDAKPQAMALRGGVSFQMTSVEAAETLAALHGECFDNPWDEQEMLALLAMPGTSAVVAIENTKPVAFALVRRAADEAEILTLGTQAPARGRGIATELLRHLLSQLQSEHIASVFIEVAWGNGAARAMYEKSGFRQTGIRKNYYARENGRREDAIIMRKPLSP